MDQNQGADRAARIEQRVNSGVLGLWYVVAKSVEIGSEPRAVKALGRNLVLWRDARHNLKCLEDRCPHRGARLSLGVVLENDIACRYHGIRINGEGSIVQVPAMADCKLVGRSGVISYEVAEANDGVFVYFPSADRPMAPKLTLPYEFEDPNYASFLCTSHWETNYRYAFDNIADPMHGCYLHDNTFTLSYGSKQDLVKIEEEPEGFSVSRVEQQGQNFDWTQWITEGATMFSRVDIHYPSAAGPGGMLRVVNFLTPIDQQNCQIFFWRCRKVVGIERDLWRFMFRAVFEPRHWFVLEQDRQMLAAMPDDARDRESLYQHDAGLTRLRRILIQKAKEQIDAEDRFAQQRNS